MKNVKRCISIILTAVLLFGMTAFVYAEDNTETHIPPVRSYDGRFSDITEDKWYYISVTEGYNYGLFEGRSTDHFDASGSIKVCELLTLAARLRSAYDNEPIDETESDDPWYMKYVGYLRGKGIFDESLTPYLEENATRAQLACIFASALPENCFDSRNERTVALTAGKGEYLPDVNDETPYHDEIIWLYNNGILSGTDDRGTFRPDAGTTRAETAALLTRMIDPSLRILLGWKAELTLGSLIDMPEALPDAPASYDRDAIDAAVRWMLAHDEHVLTLLYPEMIRSEEMEALTQAFLLDMKQYGEQMYSMIRSGCDSRGVFYADFGFDALDDETLAELRSKTIASAVEVQDKLYADGTLDHSMTEYERAKALYVWICNNCVYDHDKKDMSHLAYSVFSNGLAVCDGYTGAYDLLLKLEGIDCRSEMDISIDHIWTVAVLDGTEYHIDTTWGDQPGGIDMKCFAMTEEESARRHSKGSY